MIPKEVWNLKEEWTNLGKDVMDFQNVFLKALGAGEKEFVDFVFGGMRLQLAVNSLYKRTRSYIMEYNEDRAVAQTDKIQQKGKENE